MTCFLDYAHGESNRMGVGFWWLDWQQDYLFPVVRGTTTKHLPWLNELFYNHSKGENLRGAGFSRWGGWGDHRHPIQFSGDSFGTWETLRFLVDLTTTSGNEGCFFWAHDTGGFKQGLDKELYTRWTQFGLLNSSLRIHSIVDKNADRRPWLWGEREEKAMRKIYHMRSELMPYIYSSVRQCHTDMLPLNRGLYFEQPDAEDSYKYPYEFYFGDLILGAPVTEPGKGEDKVVDKKVFFPAGNDWYSLFTGKRYTGGTEQIVGCPLEESPVFVKAGWPMPMQPYRERMCSAPLDTLVVRCYPAEEGTNNTYTLYEDDGMTTAYENGCYALTDLTYRNGKEAQEIIIAPAEGSYAGQLEKRACRIELADTDAAARVYVNGKRVKTSVNEAIHGINIPVRSNSIRKSTAITVKH